MAASIPKLKSITTAEILKKLKEQGDGEFFYLYVSTAGKERKKKQQRLPQGQQMLNFPTQSEEDPVDDVADSDEDQDDESDRDDGSDQDQDDQDGGRDDQDNTMDSQDNSQANPVGANTSLGSQPSLSSPLSPPLSRDKTRKEAMTHVHKVILPSLLGPEGWKKVLDKDTKLTYRALYFNIIRQCSDEEELAYIQRVGQIRHKIAGEAKKVMEEHRVNFKINSLLSKPFLYNEKALEEQSIRATQTQQRSLKQRTLDEYS